MVGYCCAMIPLSPSLSETHCQLLKAFQDCTRLYTGQLSTICLTVGTADGGIKFTNVQQLPTVGVPNVDTMTFLDPT